MVASTMRFSFLTSKKKQAKTRMSGNGTPSMSGCGEDGVTRSTSVVVEKAFPQFSNIHDEGILRLIISFVADAPLELDQSGPLANRLRPASLTSSLPLVSKEFHRLANLEDYWCSALIRQLKKDSTWIMGLRRLLPENYTHNDDDNSHNEYEDNVRQRMIEAVRRSNDANIQLSYKNIYQKIITHHIQFVGPIFVMPCQISLGEVYGLHLFEPRYRLMIRDLIENCDNPDEARRGGPIRPRRVDGVTTPPLFVHACRGPRLGSGEMACLVQLVWCHVYEYGTADVRLLPVAWVRLDKIWVRPSSGHLFYAKANRI